MKLWSCCIVFAAAACGGDKTTGPVPCDTYSGGIIGSATLPGTYNLKSFCQGMKPNLVPPAATGTVTITNVDFAASVTVQGAPTTISGTYTTSGVDAIIVTLAPTVQFVGTYRVTTDSLYVSGALGGQKYAFTGTRGT
jgi:hypothetical protein